MFRKSIVLKSVLAWTATVLTTTLAADAIAEPPSAADIISAADKVRNSQGAYRLSVRLVEYVNGKTRDKVDLAVHAKFFQDTHRFKNLVRYTAPPRDTGKLVLLSGSNMWFYDPSSKVSVTLGPSPRPSLARSTILLMRNMGFPI